MTLPAITGCDCGGTPALEPVRYRLVGKDVVDWRVVCGKCELAGPNWRHKADAVRAWNDWMGAS